MKKMKIVLNVLLFYLLPLNAKKMKNIETMVFEMLLLLLYLSNSISKTVEELYRLPHEGQQAKKVETMVLRMMILIYSMSFDGYYSQLMV